MVKMFKEDFHTFENFTKYEKWIYPLTDKMHFKRNNLKDIEENVFANESLIFYGQVL